MDKVENYRSIIKQALEEYAALLAAPPEPSYEIALAFDDQHGQYILREIGWTKNNWIRETPLHIVLRNNKIWIEEDWTEEGIATYFLEHGVPSEDIVLGFQPPQTRQHTEFATA
ncbi:XisI protein [Chloroflexi bacterium TSY]|nr:XisI protein [Chloroflexi bacterium TSY]